MNVQALSFQNYRPMAATGTHLEAGETPEQFADEFKPTGAVATPADLPQFSPAQSIDNVVGRFHADWAKRMDGRERATVGILVERGWKPDGNHDEVLRGFYGTHFGGIEVCETAIHQAADGKRYLVIHGDAFDIVVRHARWLAFFGDWAMRSRSSCPRGSISSAAGSA